MEASEKKNMENIPIRQKIKKEVTREDEKVPSAAKKKDVHNIFLIYSYRGEDIRILRFKNKFFTNFSLSMNSTASSTA